ncbi:MAG: hypothetical protein HY828_06240 [Actinobacteria bacterium]|nr:hypothetical protein [Actinomycetota bacterium]
MRKLTALLLTVIVGTSTLAACGDDKPSASAWAAKVVTVCKGLGIDREAAAASSGMPTDAAPTVEQLMAFSAAFGPTFTSAVSDIKALDRPSGMDAEIDELFLALDGGAARIARGATDTAVAEEDLNSQDGAPEWVRLEAANIAAGVAECNT